MDSDYLPLSRSRADRDAHSRTSPTLLAELVADPSTRVLRVHRGRVATLEGASGGDVGLRLGTPGTLTEGAQLVYLGRDQDARYVAEIVPDVGGAAPQGEPSRVGDDPQGGIAPQFSQLREIGWQLPARDAGLAATALALANWHATHTHCPRCGTPTEVVEAGWVRRCPADESLHYPRTDPAVIMAVVDDADRILLGHAVNWPEGQFSTSAGFVEPGESLEAAVRREVLEETNIIVGAVTYRASQPWPFPASLMLGFRGRALTGDVRPDGLEITAARFFTREELDSAAAAGELRLPGRTSIARGLIEEWFGGPLLD
ncbi:MAG: NAD(+) diphosphatase [Actinomycetales bacterium]|nr:NAD(+) diphosphatase [Actinomycetales bacterium]